jgi:hypothetical protein
MLTSQVSLLSLRELILLDCITDAPRELLLKTIIALTRLPCLRQVTCLNPLWSLINDAKVAEELLSSECTFLPFSNIFSTLNVSWYRKTLFLNPIFLPLTFFRYPASRVMLTMDPTKMPFLKDLTTFVVQDWSEQGPSPFKKAASAVSSCISMVNQLSISSESQSNANESKSSIEQFVDGIMTEAQANLMQGLAPTKISPLVSIYLNQMQLLKTLHLSNCITDAHPTDIIYALGVVDGILALLTYQTSVVFFARF